MQNLPGWNAHYVFDGLDSADPKGGASQSDLYSGHRP